jgi:GTP cyclohydrolase I
VVHRTDRALFLSPVQTVSTKFERFQENLMGGHHSSKASVSDIVGVMEHLAPSDLAEEWDNCGLQVGSQHWPVRKIWVALDPLPDVVRAATQAKVDLLITHHPLFLHPLRTIDVDTTAGQVIEAALKSQMALYCAHTNLDSALNGVNHVLAEAIGMRRSIPMVALEGADEFQNGRPGTGMGRVGDLGEPITLDQLAQDVKSRLNLQAVKVAGDLRQLVHRVAICSGSGSSLLDVFLDTDAQVYISGDMRYHDARRVEHAERGLIDVSHFSSEHLVLAPLVEQLRVALQSAGWQVQVEACGLERDPFVII